MTTPETSNTAAKNLNIFLLDSSGNKKFLDSAMKRLDCWYIWPCKENNWSGRDLKIADIPNVYDCAGLALCAMHDATDGQFDHRADWNAGMMMAHCEEVKPVDLVAGDLLFYGHGKNLITHVAIYIGTTRDKKGSVLSASGGGSSTTSIDKARAIGARVRIHADYKYRPDFVCAGRMLKPVGP